MQSVHTRLAMQYRMATHAYAEDLCYLLCGFIALAKLEKCFMWS